MKHIAVGFLCAALVAALTTIVAFKTIKLLFLPRHAPAHVNVSTNNTFNDRVYFTTNAVSPQILRFTITPSLTPGTIVTNSRGWWSYVKKDGTVFGLPFNNRKEVVKLRDDEFDPNGGWKEAE